MKKLHQNVWNTVQPLQPLQHNWKRVAYQYHPSHHRPLRLSWYTIDGQYLDMEAWLKVSKGHCESGVKFQCGAEIFSAEIFSAEIFTAEPSLWNLHCGTLTAVDSLRSSSGNCPSRLPYFSASIIMETSSQWGTDKSGTSMQELSRWALPDEMKTLIRLTQCIFPIQQLMSAIRATKK